MKRRVLVSKFYIHVSRSNLYIPTIGLIWNLYYPVLCESYWKIPSQKTSNRCRILRGLQTVRCGQRWIHHQEWDVQHSRRHIPDGGRYIYSFMCSVQYIYENSWINARHTHEMVTCCFCSRHYYIDPFNYDLYSFLPARKESRIGEEGR